MWRPIRWWILPCLLCVLALCSWAETRGDDAAPIPVGVARVDITPDYPIRMNGFLVRKGESTGTRQRIWAKALAIGSDDAGPAVLITTDLLGVSDDMVQQVAASLHARVGIDPARVAVTATHTHSGPMVNGVAPNIFGEPIPADAQGRIDRYTKELAENLEKVALDALKDRRPARITWGIGTAGFAINRRTKGGPVDHDVPMLAIREPDGKLRAVYVNYACHCVTLSDTLINGDWAGYAQEHIERLHPGVTALVSVGCGADSNPSSGVTGSKADVASQQGVEIASMVDRLLEMPLRPVTGPLTIEAKRIELDLMPLPTREEFVEIGKRTDPTGYFARVQVAKLDRGESLRTKISYPVSTWAFGDSLAMVFLPGEVTVDYSLRLKRELDGRRLWVNAYANAAPCYIPSERVLKEGGYEGGGAMIYYDQPAKLAPGLEQKIVDAVLAPLQTTFGPRGDVSRTQGSRAPAPEEALLALKTLPGFTVDLVASEPLVTSPVTIDFGSDGKLWVCEMYDYPQGLDGNWQPGGRVRMLEDRDADGRFDHASVFLEGIPFPTGVTVWRKGVLVCAAPDILYAEDTDGDGKADEVRKLFSGFGTENFQARVNSLEYGLDGWVYGSCGLFGGEITNSFGKPAVSLGNRDFRCKPDTGDIEPATGRTQQGRPRDDWGNFFGCDNSNFARHYPIADHDLRRNPHVSPPASVVSLPDGAESNRIYSAAAQLQLFKLSGQGGRATAACGIGVYRDNLLGNAFQGDLFTCEPVGLVVHHLHLTPRGATFSGGRPENEQGREFLASTNNWFRPVQARTGPDGGLWVVDMSRFVIEHPRWIPEADLARLDVRAGHDLGRIFRVRLSDTPLRPWPRLDRLDATGLVQAMDSPNGWQRDMAMQQLVWNEDPAAAPLLVALLKKAERPEVRVNALCTLDILKQLETSVIASGLADVHPGVRRNAARCAAGRLDEPSLLTNVLSLVEDPDATVRLQVAATLGSTADPRAAEGLGRLAMKPGEDPFVIGTALSSVSAGNVAGVLRTVLESQPDAPPVPLVRSLIATAVAVLPAAELDSVVRTTIPEPAASPAPWHWSAAAALLESLGRRPGVREELPAAAIGRIDAFVNRSAARIADRTLPEADRTVALDLLGRTRDRQAADLETLAALLHPQEPPAVQSAAVSVLARIGSPQVPTILIERWKSLSPTIRAQSLDLFLSRPAYAAPFLDALEQGTISPASIDLPRRERLLASKDMVVVQRAEKLLAGGVNSDRAKVLASYQPALDLPGDAARGKQLFGSKCAICHRLENVGHAIGPDLAALSAKTPAFFLQEILDPNRNVDSRYVSYIAVTTAGQTHTGLLVSESGASLTLQAQEDKRVTLLRTDVEELSSSGKSLMPEGFEKELGPQPIADLIAYLTKNRPARKAFVGNNPAVVEPANGALRLLATNAEIYGDQIVFEAPFRNIGYWHGGNDLVSWRIRLPQAGKYDVWLDASCAAESDGNKFVLEAGSARVAGQVAATGGWDQYRQTRVGTLALAAGEQTVTLRPADGVVRGALMDLRGAHLVPAGTKLELSSTASEQTSSQPQSPDELATRILDDKTPKGDRERLVAASLDGADRVVAAMAEGLGDDETEEYRRIPWIWRVSVGAARRKQPEVLVRLIEVALPTGNAPLRDWQAVVIGGGVINGLGLEGLWPDEEATKLLVGNTPLQARWKRSLKLAASMADNPKVRNGTRYDALRMVALDDWAVARPLLAKYLLKETNAELQMGAVSGLSDCRSAEVPGLLIAAFGDLTPGNRSLAIGGLLRSEERRQQFVDALFAERLNGKLISPADAARITSALTEEQLARVRSRLPAQK